MLVKELIAVLSSCNTDAAVFYTNIDNSPQAEHTYPSVSGVGVRSKETMPKLNIDIVFIGTSGHLWTLPHVTVLDKIK